jgi:signal transduction histidine kinase/ligand-binding sensor domain-containing protein
MRSLSEGRSTNFGTMPKTFNIQRSLRLSVLLCLSAMSSVYGLDYGRRISQYGHTAWRVQDGAITPAGAITQTLDGYIWLGTSAGLMRFDGVRFVQWSAPKGSSLPDRRFTSLLGARDGSLWIGMTKGLSRWKDGQLQTYMNPADGAGISAIFEDRAGTIWVTRYHVPQGQGPLCRVAEKDLRCYGKDSGIPVRYGLGLAEDSLGNLWFGSSVLCRWRPGSSSTFFDDILKRQRAGDGVVDVAVGPAGSVWAAIDGVGPDLGVRYYSGGKWASYVVPGFNGASVRAHALFVDRSKSLWIGTENNGLYRVHDGVADHYGSADGLSGNSPTSFYEDHEGNLWVVTEGGVDMFRDTPVVTFSIHEGLSSAGIHSVLALRSGSVWIGNEGAVDILRAGRNSPLLAGRELPGQDVAAMFEDHTGAVWLGLDERLMIYDQGRFNKIKRSDGSTLDGDGEVIAITEDAGHDIWALTWKRQNLLRIRNHRVQEEIPLSKDLLPAAFLAADQKAGIWIGSSTGMLALYRDGHLKTIALEDRESPVATMGLIVDSDNSLLLPTALGLLRWNDRRWSVLDTRNGLPCNSIFSAVTDNSGSLWLYAVCGLLKVEALEVAKWHERADSQLEVRVFDAFDGAHPGHQLTFQPASSKAPDGRLWFLNGLVAQMVDPGHLYGNSTPPPVHIEEVVADHKKYQPQDHLRLPAMTREVEIDYTGLSLVVPQKVRFRYMLEGHDAGWEEPGTRRQAFYSDLSPGTYRFRVVACNGDGIWNETGATLAFSVAPAWYQATWFRFLCSATAIFVVWVLYRLRVRKIARAISARFDERLAERTRLARELHDTFLQTIQGSKMVADDALEQSADPVRMRRAMERLWVWLGQATEEGRAALNSLRTSTTERNDLAEALQRATEDDLVPSAMAVTFSVVGEAREMHPIVRDEVYRIGYEAIRNAAVHSRASRLEVELKYAQDLMIRVSDNGIGIDPAVADQGKDGHFGLQGMRERAARIGGKLTLVSSATSATEITLVVPGGIVFRKSKSGS